MHRLPQRDDGTAAKNKKFRKKHETTAIPPVDNIYKNIQHVHIVFHNRAFLLSFNTNSFVFLSCKLKNDPHTENKVIKTSTF